MGVQGFNRYGIETSETALDNSVIVLFFLHSKQHKFGGLEAEHRDLELPPCSQEAGYVPVWSRGSDIGARCLRCGRQAVCMGGMACGRFLGAACSYLGPAH